MYHFEFNEKDETLCGISFSPKNPGNLNVLYLSRSGFWILNKYGSGEHDKPMNVNYENVCVTCLLLYSNDSSLVFRIYSKNIE